MNRILVQIVSLATFFTISIPFSLATETDSIEEGKQIVFDRTKGNCLACHAIAGGELVGNLGPELVNIKSRYPEKADLRAQIWDASKNNPATSMPPFGRHRMLTEEELNKVVEFIYSL